jgi:catechol 2,3-dioxygenase-like lactoylglutathione lyase family enzyme
VFDHVAIRVADGEASRRFYELAFPNRDRLFLVADEPRTQRLHLGFGVESRDAVDSWWRRMVDAGYASDGEPGPRPQYTPDYYGAFVLDPDGNSVEAMHHEHSRVGLDHLWLRSGDVDAQRRFYGTIAHVVGLRLRDVDDDWVLVTDGDGSFSFVAGEPVTQHVHYAFTAPDRETVDAFHHVATAAGYTDNGRPGERPQYHPGYYAAFVLDPDGHNVEAVYHGR